MSAAANVSRPTDRLDIATLQAGLAIIVFAVLPMVPHAFAAPKEAALCLASAFALLLAAAETGRRVRPWPWRWYLILALPLLAMSAAAASESHHLYSSDGVVRAWSYAAFGLAIHLSCIEPTDIDRLTGTAAILGAVQSILILLQVPFGDAITDVSNLPSAKWLAFGTIGNPNWVGALIAATLPLAWLRAAAAPAGWHRFAWCGAGAVMAAALVLTFSRGAWVGATAGIVVACGFAASARSWRVAMSAALGVGLGAVIAAATLPADEISGAVSRTASLAGRLRMWEITADMIADQPLLGVGPAAYAGRYPEYQRAYVRRADSTPPLTQLTDQPHDEYLRLAAEAGVPALAGFAAVCALLLTAARRVRDAGADLAGGIAALLACAIADNPLQVPATTALFCLLAVALLTRAAAMTAPAPRRLSILEQAGLAAAAVLLLAQGVRVLVVERHYATARTAMTRGAWPMAEYFARAGLQLERQHGELWGILARCHAAAEDLDGFEAALRQTRRDGLVPSLEYTYAAVELRRRRTEEAVRALVDVRDTLPGLVRPHLMLAQVYLQSGNVDAARRELQAIPAVPSGDRATRRLAEQAGHLLESLDALDEQTDARAGAVAVRELGNG